MLKDVNAEVEKDLCSLDTPYLVASVFQSGTKLVYFVGKPVATSMLANSSAGTRLLKVREPSRRARGAYRV